MMGIVLFGLRKRGGTGTRGLVSGDVGRAGVAEHLVQVIDLWVGSLDMGRLGFTKAQPAATGRPPYDPADLLKLYLYGYLNQIRSSRRVERECRRNIEVL